MASRVTNAEIISALFPETPANWDSRIDTTSKSAWEQTKVVIAGDEFAPIRNQIFDALINRIGLVKIKNNSFNNPLSVFKSGTLPFGDAIQEIAVDVVTGERYQTGNQDQFEVKDPTVQAAYFVQNRQQFYRTTVYDAQLQYAFTNEYGLQRLINEIISQLTNSNTIDEFLFTKQTLLSAYKSTDYVPKETQKLTVPDILTNKTVANINEFIETVKIALRRVQFPSRNFNASGQMKQVAPSDLVLILNCDVLAINEVNNLAFAFKPQYLDLNIPIIAVDDFEDSELLGAVVSRSFIDVRDTKNVFTTAENARALYVNYYYHVHQIYTASPFETALYLVKGS